MNTETPAPHPTAPAPPAPTAVQVEWTVPPFGVIFGVVWRTGLAIIACYGLLFVGIALAVGAIAGAAGA